MDNKGKIALGVLGALGVLTIFRYIHRQGKALKNLCISNVSWNWVDALQGTLLGGAIPDTAQMEFKATNNSDIDLTIKEINLVVTVDDKIVGTIKSPMEQQVLRNSTRDIYVTIDFDVNLDANLLFDIIDIIADPDPTQFGVDGYFTVSASLFENYTYRYNLLTTKDQIISEVAGDCT